MEPEDDGLETPELLALEDQLARNYGEFQVLAAEWSRLWQRAMVRRAMRRQRTKPHHRPLAHNENAAPGGTPKTA